MPVLTLLLYLALLGLVVWGIVKIIPMPPAFQGVIIAVGVIVAVGVLLRAFGISFNLGTVPHLR